MSATVSASRMRPMRSVSSIRRTASWATFASISGKPSRADSSKQSRSRMPSRLARRDQLGLVREVGVAADEVGRAVEDALIGAPVVGQRQPPSREPGADVLDLGVAPAVDGLLGVADRRNVAEVDRGGEPDEVELDSVGVLELVDDQVAESLPAQAPKLGNSLERVDDLEQEVIEIAQRLGVESVLVGAVDREQDLDRLQLGARRVGSP